MKKKIFSFLLAICLIIPAMFTMSACNEEPPADTNIYVSTEAQLKQAVSQSADKSKIVLTNNIELTEQLTVLKELTIDLAGFTISNNTVDIWDDTDGVDTWSLISVQENGNLTITGNGKLTAKMNDCYAVDVRNNAVVTIKNGTFNGNVSAVYVIGNATANIDGGFFTIQQLSSKNDYRFLLNAFDANNQDAKIIVKGGKFREYDPSHSNSENPQMNFVAEGYQSVEDGYGNYVVSKIAE